MAAEHPSSQDALIGQPCSVNDPAPRLGLTCAPNGQWKTFAPRIANAYKGDIILTPGCGLIGDLLRSVSPPQIYSHSGLVVENFSQIRHSTSAQGRYSDNANDILFIPDVDGIDANMLRYGWPGILTQSVEEAYTGEPILSPDGKFYTIDGFSASPAICGDISLGRDIVVRPMPGSDPQGTTRARLGVAADLAKTINGHYRFFAYTNAAIADDRSYDAPRNLRWNVRDESLYPAIATVCSSFIWHVMKLAGIDLEGPQLEENDVRLGAQRDDATLDGLYLYTEAERLAGAYQLTQSIQEEVLGEQGGAAKVGEALFGAISKVQNQTANCFGFDDCGNKSQTRWKQPGIGRAVSPDNMLLWDAPASGGVYGFHEEIDYHGGEHVQLGSWQPAPNTGGIVGRVQFQGQGFAGATVRIAKLDTPDTGKFVELTSSGDGSFSDGLLPAGQYQIVASATVNNAPVSKQITVNIVAGQTAQVDLLLELDADFKHEVQILGSVFIFDDEIPVCFPIFGCVNEDETGTFQINETRVLDPIVNRRAEIKLGGHNQLCVGDEVRVELDLLLRLEDDNQTVTVSGEARLFEGTNCKTDDKEDTKSIEATIPSRGSTPQSVRLDNSGVGGGDWAKFDILINNLRAPES